MYKIIIADDEDLIREGLKTFVDWNGMGFFIVGEAADGNKAYELVTERQPHVLLTDIKMPFCTGIELMEKIRKCGHNVRIIVLSGYDEFEYARASLDAGARGYLLKPIKFDKLRELLLRVKAELDAETLEQSRKSYANRLLRHDLIRQWLEGRPIDSHEAEQSAEQLGMSMTGKRCGILLAEIDKCYGWLNRYTKEEWEALLLRLQEAAAAAFGGVGEVYDFPRDACTVGLLLVGDSLSFTVMKEAAARFVQCVSEEFPFSVTLGAGGIGFLPDLEISYRTALRLLDRKFFLGSGRLITVEEEGDGAPASSSQSVLSVPSAAPSDPIHRFWQSERLLVLLENQEAEEVRACVHAVFSGLSTKQEAIDAYSRFMRFMADFLHKNSLPPPARLVRFDSDHPPHQETLGEILEEIDEVVAAVMELMRSASFKRKSYTIEEVKTYIEARYADNLSLESAAQHIHVHPVYLSKIFKKETGTNFIDYLTEVRINRAKQFLADASLKIYEVSDKVGYSDPKHFSKIFKLAIGVTPYEYRKVVLGYKEDQAGF